MGGCIFLVTRVTRNKSCANFWAEVLLDRSTCRGNNVV